MKLWLDDERNPTDPAIQERFGADGDEVWVKTAAAAIQKLSTGCFTSVSLDHDLGSGCGDGQQVADWIENMAREGKLPRLTWAVHSMNVVGRKTMTHALMRADGHWGDG